MCLYVYYLYLKLVSLLIMVFIIHNEIKLNIGYSFRAAIVLCVLQACILLSMMDWVGGILVNFIPVYPYLLLFLQ